MPSYNRFMNYSKMEWVVELTLFGNFLMIKVRHNFTIINGRLAYIPQYGGEVTTTAKQHKKVPNAVGVS